MSISQGYLNLFRHSTISDQLDFFQSLLDSGDLTFHTALALLNAIRAELESPRAHRSSIYVHYGTLTVSLHAIMPDVYEQVLHAWKAKRGTQSSEALPGSRSLPLQKTLESDENFFEEEGQVEGKPAYESHDGPHWKASAEESETELESSEGEVEPEDEPPAEAGE